MGKDRKHMEKLREKRIKSLKKQVEKHENKIKNEKGRLDTTKAYWQKEIDEKFLKQIRLRNLSLPIFRASLRELPGGRGSA